MSETKFCSQCPFLIDRCTLHTNLMSFYNPSISNLVSFKNSITSWVQFSAQNEILAFLTAASARSSQQLKGKVCSFLLCTNTRTKKYHKPALQIGNLANLLMMPEALQKYNWLSQTAVYGCCSAEHGKKGFVSKTNRTWKTRQRKFLEQHVWGRNQACDSTGMGVRCLSPSKLRRK